ncbi:MAG: DUF115 domain-containing protein [Phycisphaerales bacterium]|nr:MAG: DUF115 domain-containing protein [Phycisphaerales bacterium]
MARVEGVFGARVMSGCRAVRAVGERCGRVDVAERGVSAMSNAGRDAGVVAASEAVFERNCRLLERTSAETVRRVRATPARAEAEFVMTDDGVPTCLLRTADGTRTLASRRRPLAEADRLVSDLDVRTHAGVVLLGFGLGYHARAAAAKLRKTGVMIAIEPDVALLRSVLERVDLSGWFEGTNLAILTDPDDAPALSRVTRGVEGVLGLGVKFLETTPDRQRLGEALDRFAEQFNGVMRAIRSQLMTTMVQVETTLRNSFMNLDRYATSAKLSDLAGACHGRPAVVVSAGPSLQRNLDLLSEPGVRERVVIVAVQTVLKPMLARGIRPHFVTALDHHEISRRFYEGLKPEDVEGVTLVLEPKANPAIAEAFPGKVRFVSSELLDTLLGEELAGKADERDRVHPGATVAHLAYELARHLGADPVMLIGQDLGFTDGQYYAGGAAIHETWGPELNPFRTLEMMEWERIARMRSTLIRTTDVLGRPVYTDEQMHSYLVQFEEHFARDAARGLTTIDATEGGVAKRGTSVMTLGEALVQHASDGSLPTLPARFGAPASGVVDDRKRLARVRARVARVRQDVGRVAALSRETSSLLGKMLGSDQPTINTLIGRVNAIRDEVTSIAPAYGLVHDLNQTGTLRRFRADRLLSLEDGIDAYERQRRQIERDRDNVAWLADAGEQLGRLLDATLKAFDGGAKLTRDMPPSKKIRDEVELGGAVRAGAGAHANAKRARRQIAAVIPVDPARSGLGIPRDLGDTIALGRNALRLTLERLGRCKKIDRVILLATDPERVRALTGGVERTGALPIEILRVERVRTRAHRAVAASRVFAPLSWRGSLGGLTAWDEVFDAAVFAEVFERTGIDAAVPVGDDWALASAELIDAAAQRHREQPKGHPYAFAPAPVGLGALVINRELTASIAHQSAQAGAFGSIGGILGYVPSMPRGDALGRGPCVQTDASLRKLAVRLTADTPIGRALIAGAIEEYEERWLTIGAEKFARHAARRDRVLAGTVPQHVIMELNTGRRTSGQRASWNRDGGDVAERMPMDVELAGRLFRELCAERPDAVVTLDGAGDPLLHPAWREIVAAANEAGVRGLHVRTDLLCEEHEMHDLLAGGVDVVSVDLMGEHCETYRRLMGVDALERARTGVLRLLAARGREGTFPFPWVAPRLTRCDAVYEEIEAFYDRWLSLAGACVIDPLPSALRGQRIAPLPEPGFVRARMERLRCRVLSDGDVPIRFGGWRSGRTMGSVRNEALESIWKRVLARRRERAFRRERAARQPRLSPTAAA